MRREPQRNPPLFESVGITPKAFANFSPGVLAALFIIMTSFTHRYHDNGPFILPKL